MTGRYIVGAYPASPCTAGWVPALEARFFAALEAAGFVDGLELPLWDDPADDHPEWLVKHVRREWRIVLTTLPGTMRHLKSDAVFGLASNDESARRRALTYCAFALETVKRLNDGLGRSAVVAVELHSAPRQGAGVVGDAQAFQRSLEEVISWDWEGAILSLEHCDAWVPGHKPAKGFLALDDEITAIRASSGRTPLGMAVNWGRSAIEARDPAAPRRHLERLREEGLLNGLIFSGTAADDPLYGDWEDYHVPFANGREPDRHMTLARARECLAAVRGLPLTFLGFKLQTLPKELSVPERISVLRQAASVLDAAQA